MIEERYVDHETAKLLKEKGFDGDCFVAYNANGNIESAMELYGEETITNGECSEGDIAAPTQQMAMAWLREEHNIFIEVRVYQYTFDGKYCYEFDIFHHGSRIVIDEKVNMKFYSYEETVESALKHCLNNLI